MTYAAAEVIIGVVALENLEMSERTGIILHNSLLQCSFLSRHSNDSSATNASGTYGWPAEIKLRTWARSPTASSVFIVKLSSNPSPNICPNFLIEFDPFSV